MLTGPPNVFAFLLQERCGNGAGAILNSTISSDAELRGAVMGLPAPQIAADRITMARGCKEPKRWWNITAEIVLPFNTEEEARAFVDADAWVERVRRGCAYPDGQVSSGDEGSHRGDRRWRLALVAASDSLSARSEDRRRWCHSPHAR
jgi:hypothetical protein